MRSRFLVVGGLTVTAQKLCPELRNCYPDTIYLLPRSAAFPVANVSFWDGMQFRVSAKYDDGTVIGNVTQSRDFNGDLTSHFSEVLEILSPAGGNFKATIGIPNVGVDPIECKMILGPYDNQYIYLRGEVSYFNSAVQLGGGSPAIGEYYTYNGLEIHLRADGYRDYSPSMNWFDVKSGMPSNMTTDPSVMNPQPINPKYQAPKTGNLTTAEEFLAIVEKYGQAPGGHEQYWVVGNFTNPIPRLDEESGEAMPYGTATLMVENIGTWTMKDVDATDRAYWISTLSPVVPTVEVEVPVPAYHFTSWASPKFAFGVAALALFIVT